MFVVVRSFDYQTFEEVIGPFETRQQADDFVKSVGQTEWDLDVTELTPPTDERS